MILESVTTIHPVDGSLGSRTVYSLADGQSNLRGCRTVICPHVLPTAPGGANVDAAYCPSPTAVGEAGVRASKIASSTPSS